MAPVQHSPDGSQAPGVAQWPLAMEPSTVTMVVEPLVQHSPDGSSYFDSFDNRYNSCFLSVCSASLSAFPAALLPTAGVHSILQLYFRAVLH